MVDRNYSNVIILCYPPGAGGNFLINCLSLNDRCVLRDAMLAKHQLDNGMTPIEKLKYFQKQISTSIANNKWNDLNLGCLNFFGVNNLIYFLEDPNIVQQKLNYITTQSIQLKKYLFLVAHTTQHVEAYCKFWTNAKIIFLTDYHDFVRRRGYIRNHELRNFWDMVRDAWNTAKDSSWSFTPPTSKEEFLNLPLQIQNTLVDNFPNNIFKHGPVLPAKQEMYDQTVKSYIEQLNGYDWNVKKNFSGDKNIFLTELHKCADWAGLSIDADDSLITEYYEAWLSAIFAINPRSSRFVSPK